MIGNRVVSKYDFGQHYSIQSPLSTAPCVVKIGKGPAIEYARYTSRAELGSGVVFFSRAWVFVDR